MHPGPVAEVLASQILAQAVLVFTLVKVSLLPPVFTPSMVTYLAFSILINAAQPDTPVIVAFTPDAGRMVSVLVALA